MNPEFQRNLWLELNPTRVVTGILVLGLVFMLGGAGSGAAGVAGAASGAFGVLVGIWGTFKAARTVTDEVRDRTWDSQRMSGLAPLDMTLGKLFGATIYCWLGGAICLATYAIARTIATPSAPVALEVVNLALAGLLAHATALAASLAGARRRRGQTRTDAFLFFLAGLIAYWTIQSLTGIASTFSSVSEDVLGETLKPVVWWGVAIEANVFSLGSVLVFAALAIATAWRLMRIELQARSAPLWYAAGAMVAVLWLVGLPEDPTSRLISASISFAVLTWATVWIEPKDVVAWRGLVAGAPHRAALWPAALTGLALTWAAALASAFAMSTLGATEDVKSPLAPIAATLFLTRDVGLFAFFHLDERAKRADFSAVLTIVLLYVLGPGLLGAMTGSDVVKAAFFVDPGEGNAVQVVSVISAALQAVAVAAMVGARWRARAAPRGAQPAPA